MKMNIILTAAGVACFAIPAFANEASIEQKAQHYFEKIDTNKDSKISKAEHDAFGAQMFSEADTNKDNSITLAELTAEKKKEKDEMNNAGNDAAKSKAE